MTRRAVWLVALLLLVGCGKHYWSKPGAGFGEFSKDNTECAQENALHMSEDRKYGIVHLDLYRACLRGRGWSRAQQVDPVPSGWFRGLEDDETVRLDAPPSQPRSALASQAPSTGLPSTKPAAAALIGTWTGTLIAPWPAPGGPARSRYPALLQISDEGGRLTWSLEVRGDDLDGSGTVEASAQGVNLSGKFSRRDLPISYSVTVSDSDMDAMGMAQDNRLYQLSLKRRP